MLLETITLIPQHQQPLTFYGQNLKLSEEVIGGEYDDSETSNYYATAQYEVKFTPVILNGILYYTQYPGSTTFPTGTIAVDLRTGQTLWTSTTL